MVDIRVPFAIKSSNLQGFYPLTLWRHFSREPLSVRNDEPYSPTFMIGDLNLPKKLDPLPADFENLKFAIFIELGKQVRGWWLYRVCSSTPKKNRFQKL